GRLADTLDSAMLAEAPEENPFLADFYAAPENYALATQLSFLLQRARQIDGLRQADLFGNGCIADFMFDKDPLFARLTLDGAELSLYEEIYRRLAWQAPRPDRVIYLHAPVDVLMQRVAHRDRVAERRLAADYMVRVAAAYRRFFDNYRAAPLIVVDAAQFDLQGAAADYRALLDALATDERRIELVRN